MTLPRSLTSLRSLVAVAILGALPATFCPVSIADPGVTVKYSDLDIQEPADARLLYERIRVAARSACNYFWFRTDADEAHCLQSTIADAVARVNHPALTAIYDTKYPISAPSSLVSQSH